MGYSDRMFEDALNDLREQNKILEEENKALKKFLEFLIKEAEYFTVKGRKL